MINRFRIKWFNFRIIKRDGMYNLKKGLYFHNTFDKIDKSDRLNANDIIALRNWLNIYIENFINDKPTNFETCKSKLRASLKSLEKLESQSLNDTKKNN